MRRQRPLYCYYTTLAMFGFLTFLLPRAAGAQQTSDAQSRKDDTSGKPDAESNALLPDEPDHGGGPPQGGSATRRPRAAMIEDLYSSNLAVLYTRSSLVFVGTVTQRRVKQPPNKSILHTAYTFEVTELLKGRTDNGTLHLINTGGEDTQLGIHMGTAFSFRLTPGHTYVVFLREPYDTYVLPFIRVFAIVDDGQRITDEHGRPIIALSPTGEIICTRESLYPRLHYGNARYSAILLPPMIQPLPGYASRNTISFRNHGAPPDTSPAHDQTSVTLDDLTHFLHVISVRQEDAK